MATPASSVALQIVLNTKDFQPRCRYWLISAAIAVMAEVNTTPGHTLRIAFAQKVLANQYDLPAFAIACATNPTIATELATDAAGFGEAVPDGDLQFTVNSLFSAFAGVAN